MHDHVFSPSMIVEIIDIYGGISIKAEDNSPVTGNRHSPEGLIGAKEFIQFLYIARGSVFEVVTLLTIFCRLRWLGESKFEEMVRQAEEITKMLNALIKSMK